MSQQDGVLPRAVERFQTIAHDEVPLTKQASKEECDINEILRRAGATGFLPVNAGKPVYMDVVGLPDYHAYKNAIAEAEEKFMALPAKLRERFKNDPGALIDFVSDEKNRKEAEDLGLVPKPPPPPEPPLEAAPPA